MPAPIGSGDHRRELNAEPWPPRPQSTPDRQVRLKLRWMTPTYARKRRAGHRLTQPNRRKSPTERKQKAGTARSGGRIVEPTCGSVSDGVRPKNATDTGRHRQTSGQIEIMKKRSATQAIKPPALHRKGRTDEAGSTQHQRGLARPRLRSKPDRDLDVARHHQRRGAASGRIESRSQAINRCELRQLAWLIVRLREGPAPAIGRTAALDLRRSLEYAKRCHGRIRVTETVQSNLWRKSS